LLDWEKCHVESAPLLNTVELFLLLAAVLFHDIGRITDNDNHGKESRNLIEHNFAALSIPSRELAYSLGRICEFHDAPPDIKRFTEAAHKLHDVVIDPYGEVRELTLSTLLTLADHMDSASQRVLPNYLFGYNPQPIGAFRNIITGVVFDHCAQMIRVELSLPYSEEPGPNDDKLIYSIPKQKQTLGFSSHVEIKDRDVNDLIQKCQLDFYYRDIAVLLLSDLQYPISDNDHLLIKRYIEDRRRQLSDNANGESSLIKPRAFGPIEWHIINGHLRANLAKGGKQWPTVTLLAMVLNDLRENASFLQVIKGTLASFNMPAQSWLFEYNEHLYTWQGKETFEPIFYKEWLQSVIKAMWRMSVSVFGHSDFSYESLAAQLREPDIQRIRMAVRRIAIVTERMIIEPDPTEESAIWYSDQTWRWNAFCMRDGLCRNCRSTSITLQCKFVPHKVVWTSIENLADPT